MKCRGSAAVFLIASCFFASVQLAGCSGGGGGGGGAPQETSPPGKTFGGPGNDYGFSVQQTSDGGYVISGTTNSKGNGKFDAYLIKVDAAGTAIRELVFGGPGIDSAYDVQQTADGGYVITGVYSVVNTNPDPSFAIDLAGELFVRKVDADFNLLWEKTYASNIIEQNTCVYTLGYSIRQTLDGGFIVAGSCSVNVGGGTAYVIKLDSSGTKVWESSDFFGDEMANGIRQTSSGGYIVSTSTRLIKLDSSGMLDWAQETDGASTPIGGTAQSVCVGGGGEYFISGISNFIEGVSPGDLYLAKYSADGTLLSWEKTFGSQGGDEGFSIQETAGDGVVAVGRGSMIENHLFEVYMVKTDADGNLQWWKSFGGFGNDVGRSLQKTSDGGYIIAGYTESKGAGGYDVYLIKTDKNGNSQW